MSLAILHFPSYGLIDLKPPLLINRFMINLRSVTPSSSSSPPREASVFFAPLSVPDSVLGNIGQPLYDNGELHDSDRNVPPSTEHTANDLEADGEDNLHSTGVRSMEHGDEIPLSTLQGSHAL